MNESQKIVAKGAASGVAVMVLSVFVLYLFLPDVAGMTSPALRLVYALQVLPFALIPLLVGVITVGNQRFLSDAINPLMHAENQKIEVNGRVVENTVQQTLLFVVSTLALATHLPSGAVQLIPALVSVFVIARFVFWIGYRINPLYRAPGMAATGYMNVGIIIASLYFFIF